MADYHPDTNKFKSLIDELKIPSMQQAIFLKECDRTIAFIRDDLIHPVISGNKWRKLQNHIKYFSECEYAGISSMGGAYSNHLHALAFVCNRLDIPCSLFIYGWNGETNSPTLNDCENWNAKLSPITRHQAALFRTDGIKYLDEIYPNYYWIPEGGGGPFGELGMKDLVAEFPTNFDQKESLIVCACGTGTSINGILNQTKNCHIATMQIVKMANYPWIKNERIKMIHSTETHSFAKNKNRFIGFIDYFKSHYDILLDPIYTAPLMDSFLQYKEMHYYNKIYFIHTGGLQANRIK